MESYDFETQEFGFHSFDGYSLTGELVLPQGKPPAGVALLQQGSTHCDRNGHVPRTGFPSSLYRRLAHKLARKGFASFRYDKRQFDRPASEPLDYSLMQRVADLVHAAQALRNQPALKNWKIFLIGHSEGGLIAQMAATEFQAQGVAVISSPATSLFESLRWRHEHRLSSLRKKQQEEARQALEAWHELHEKIQMKTTFTPAAFEAYMKEKKSSGIFQGWESWPWLREHYSLRIAQVIKRLECQALYIHGKRDHTVDPKSLQRYQEFWKQNDTTQAEFIMLDQLGHFLEDVSRKHFTLHDGLIETLSGWLHKHTLA